MNIFSFHDHFHQRIWQLQDHPEAMTWRSLHKHKTMCKIGIWCNEIFNKKLSMSIVLVCYIIKYMLCYKKPLDYFQDRRCSRDRGWSRLILTARRISAHENISKNATAGFLKICFNTSISPSVVGEEISQLWQNQGTFLGTQGSQWRRRIC